VRGLSRMGEGQEYRVEGVNAGDYLHGIVTLSNGKGISHVHGPRIEGVNLFVRVAHFEEEGTTVKSFTDRGGGEIPVPAIVIYGKANEATRVRLGKCLNAKLVRYKKRTRKKAGVAE